MEHALSLSEVDQDHWHVVTAFSHCARHVRAETSIKPIITNLINANFALHLHVDIVHYLLIRVEFPNTVASHHDEINLRVPGHRTHIRERSNLLLLCIHSLIFLVCQVADCSWKIKVPINTALIVDEASSTLDSLSFRRISRLVIKWQSICFAEATHYWSGVTRVCTVNHCGLLRRLVLRHVKDHIGGTAFLLHVLLFFCLLF